MSTASAALYLDFDNVFGGLLKLDPKVALRFARTPAVWVDRLSTEVLTDGPRRWLVLRCYMNPAGSVPHPERPGERLYFSGFRLAFTDAGFEVVDCPRLTSTKNGADIRMALDALEAVGADVPYNEFVIASGDSDMTPLLVRLRSADRRTTVISPSDSAVVLGAIADRLVRGEEMLELLEEPTTGAEPSLPSAQGLPRADDASSRFGRLVLERYRAADRPLNLAGLGQHLRSELGPASATDGWLGHPSLKEALRGLDLPGLQLSTHFVWDSHRHDPPEEAQSMVAPEETPGPVERVSAVLRLPRLDRAAWSPIYEALAAHVAAHEFTLSETTRWARDELREAGLEVSRRAVTLVAQGSVYGGCPLYREPPPTAEEIGEAFRSNVIDRAGHADVELSEDDVDTLRDWFGAART